MFISYIVLWLSEISGYCKMFISFIDRVNREIRRNDTSYRTVKQLSNEFLQRGNTNGLVHVDIIKLSF